MSNDEPKPATALVPAAPRGGGWVMPRNLAEAMTLADVFARSAVFPSIRNAGQALAVIMAGAELGFSPFASLSGVHLIEGRPTIGSHLIAAAIRGSGRYDYEVLEHTDAVCSVAFKRRQEDGTWQTLGTERITLEDARAKGWHLVKGGGEKGPWVKTPKNMLFARCLSNGYRFHCADIAGGMVMYDRDEADDLAPPPAGLTQAEQAAGAADAEVVPPEPPTPGTAPALASAAPATNADGEPLAGPEVLRRLDRLFNELVHRGKTQEELAARVKTLYGTSDRTRLTAVQAEYLAGLMEARLAKFGNGKQGAPAETGAAKS